MELEGLADTHIAMVRLIHLCLFDMRGHILNKSMLHPVHILVMRSFNGIKVAVGLESFTDVW